MLQEELSKLRLVPGIKCRVTKISKRLLGGIILIVSPCGSGVPVLLDGFAKVCLGDIVGEGDVVHLEPSLEFVCIPGVERGLAINGRAAEPGCLNCEGESCEDDQ